MAVGLLDINLKSIGATMVLMALVLTSISCGVWARNSVFFGRTDPPARNILRYVTGDEPESLDPQISSGQPEARIYMALYEGAVEYDPKTSLPIPAMAERWDINNDSSEFVFHLRNNARWSNGDPITAHDYVYSIRRGVTPETAARAANLAYYIKYAEAYNSGAVFVRDPTTKQFLLAKDFAAAEGTTSSLSQTLVKPEEEYRATPAEGTPDSDTPFHQQIHAPSRLTLPGDDKARNKLLAANQQLATAVAGKEFVKVRAEDIGVEAVTDYVLRITLSQSASFFIGLMAHQLFRPVPQKAIETYKERWTEPGHIVTSGPFKVKSWRPYTELVVERNRMYWDAANVRLEEIHFYPMIDNPMIMNLYKFGGVDAVLNHTVPYFWLEVIGQKKDYMNGPEAAIAFININV